MSVYIPGYRVLGKLGTGARSTLYHVRYVHTGEEFTVKSVKLQEDEDEKVLAQLRHEYSTGSSLEHPVLRKVFELRYVRKRFRIHQALLFMEYVDGVSMASSEFAATIPELLDYFVRAAEGITAMHKAGIVHADLKPGNLLITPQQQVKLIDFGQSSRMLEAKGRVQGTPDYMAPEQASARVLDQRTDVFGLGATLHRVLTGRAIATEMNRTVSLHYRGLLGRRVSERSDAPEMEMPVCLARLMEACCRADPAERLSDMREFINRAELAKAILVRQDGQARAASTDA